MFIEILQSTLAICLCLIVLIFIIAKKILAVFLHLSCCFFVCLLILCNFCIQCRNFIAQLLHFFSLISSLPKFKAGNNAFGIVHVLLVFTLVFSKWHICSTFLLKSCNIILKAIDTDHTNDTYDKDYCKDRSDWDKDFLIESLFLCRGWCVVNHVVLRMIWHIIRHIVACIIARIIYHIICSIVCDILCWIGLILCRFPGNYVLFLGCFRFWYSYVLLLCCFRFWRSWQPGSAACTE